MTSERREEINRIFSELTKEFRDGTVEGSEVFGVLCMSADLSKEDLWTSLECNRALFKTMIASLMNNNPLVGEDIYDVAINHYHGNLPANIKALIE